MSRSKASNGVQATVERLTNHKPCPEYLRAAANKYLDSSLFPVGKRSEKDRAAKLADDGADVLLINALSLDQVFRGDTEKVASIIRNKVERKQLEADLDEAQREIERRFEVYAYWKQRFVALKTVLLDQTLDLTRERLDENLQNVTVPASAAPSPPFALRAIQHLEAIEERGRLGRLTAKEYVEQADAYMALGDFHKAAQKAHEAIECDPQSALGWFILVMSALKQRNAALHEMQHHKMTAEEVAEPMSSQESWALQMADEQSSRAVQFHEDLDQILPKALTNWPRSNRGHHEHPDEYVFVRKLFIEHMFLRIRPGIGRINSRFCHEINGLGPEWVMSYRENPHVASIVEQNPNKSLPFSDDERALLSRLVGEYDKEKSLFTFFGLYDHSVMARDFKFLHLRWVLKFDGYAEHWAEWEKRAAEYCPSRFEESILSSDQLSQLWQNHQSANHGNTAISSALRDWQLNTIKERSSESNEIVLRQNAILFHRQFARSEFLACYQTANSAEELANRTDNPRSLLGHHSDEMTSVPLRSPKYWQYLGALSVVEASLAGQKLHGPLLELLIDASAWLLAFKGNDDWLWIESEFYDEGGGDEYPVEPYNRDLRDSAVWGKAIKAQLALSIDASATTRLELTLAAVAGMSCSSPL